NKTSFSYPQTIHSVGISNKTSFSYPQTFHSVGISNKTSFSYPQTIHSVGISNKTSFSYPQTIHAEAEEGYRRSSSSRWQPYVNKASINTARKVFLEIQAVFLWKNP
ncbi:MAG: hypothetical protein MSA29_11900, partial [Lachnospiraceae bacterium]|nr:hypothetical protein [Lachnospiraceae bacterium]